MSLTKKCHNHIPQTNPRHHKEETQITDSLSTARSSQFSDDCKTRRDTMNYTTKLGCFRHVRNSNNDEGSRSHTRFADCKARTQHKPPMHTIGATTNNRITDSEWTAAEATRPRDSKTFCMLNSAEHVYPAHKC